MKDCVLCSRCCNSSSSSVAPFSTSGTCVLTVASAGIASVWAKVNHLSNFPHAWSANQNDKRQRAEQMKVTSGLLACTGWRKLLQKVTHGQNCGRLVQEHRGYHFISIMGIASRRCHMPHWISERHRRLWTERVFEPMTYQRLSE